MPKPEITKRFEEKIEKDAEKGIYRIKIPFRDEMIPMDVYPTVFPPSSEHSISSKILYTSLGEVRGKKILEIGSGTGITSIICAKLGAEHVDAVDVSKEAVLCTQNNVLLNNQEDIVSVFESDIFSNVLQKKYDLIIANLPILNLETNNESNITKALYDPGLKLHKELFSKAHRYLSEGGLIILTHANLLSKDTSTPMADFTELESLLSESGLSVISKVSQDELGYTWICYNLGIQM